MYEYVKLNPGSHYNRIKQKLSLKNGTLAYHLRTLEMQKFVKSARLGMMKRFYPIDLAIPQERGVQLSLLQMKIAKVIEKNPGITQIQLVGKMKLKQQVVSYNLKAMERNGVIRGEKVSRHVEYYLAEDKVY